MFKYFAIGSLGAMAFGLLSAYGGAVEGRYFPAVSDFEITRMEPAGPLSVRIWGEFYRPREGCNFAGLSWYLGTPERSSIAPITFEEGAVVREGGGADFGPWVIGLTPGQLLDNSYAIASHDCHPVWITRTEMYP